MFLNGINKRYVFIFLARFILYYKLNLIILLP